METDAEIKKRVNEFYDRYFRAETEVNAVENRIRKDQNQRIANWIYAIDMSELDNSPDAVREYICQHLITEFLE